MNWRFCGAAVIVHLAFLTLNAQSTLAEKSITLTARSRNRLQAVSTSTNSGTEQLGTRIFRRMALRWAFRHWLLCSTSGTEMTTASIAGGLGEWPGRAAWLVDFQQLPDRKSRIRGYDVQCTLYPVLEGTRMDRGRQL
jgi:hypothetical protein